ncbi:MAG TPA: hypothetical protein PKA88_34390, partial [Polyangiaceae bacterium]|nr:hypothetical protein [Polyangiaceae bacterium]
MVFRRVTWVAAIAAIVAVACKREDTPPARAPNPYGVPGQQGQAGPPAPGPEPQPQPYPSQGAPPPVATAPPATPPPATGPQPLGGIPCASDNDFQCPFARCVGGRCGGCRTDADCKAGAGCFSTPVGPSCM